jgi:hypothetical protein
MLASHRSFARAVTVALSLAGGGCLDRVVPAHSPDERYPDEAELSALLSGQQYRGAGFVRLDRAAYASTMRAGDLIHVYVSRDAAAVYAQLDPRAAPDRDLRFPVGGVIVREVVDERGQLRQLTLAARVGSGYFPDGGDLFYGSTDAAGTPLPGGDGGHLQWGRLGECNGCHAERARQSYLFGVLADERAVP